jgi:predicted Zn-dependent protease
MIEGHERTLVAAQGFCELGMFDDALAELDSLPAEYAPHPTVVELRTVVLMQAKRWKLALTTSRSLCRISPDKTTGFIHAAFCLHELGRTTEARDTLLSGPELLHKEPTYHYNLACYECALGNLDLARLHLEKSFELDKKFKEYARSDPDLAALRE